jgi:hypothetical protein
MTTGAGYLRKHRTTHVHRPPATSRNLCCHCTVPQPQPVYLFDTILIADAFECQRCGRKVLC